MDDFKYNNNIEMNNKIENQIFRNEVKKMEKIDEFEKITSMLDKNVTSGDILVLKKKEFLKEHILLSRRYGMDEWKGIEWNDEMRHINKLVAGVLKEDMLIRLQKLKTMVR